jgi:hypothetical protein
MVGAVVEEELEASEASWVLADIPGLVSAIGVERALERERDPNLPMTS